MGDVMSLERDMRASDSSRDHEIAGLAGGQQGVVAHRQLLALGLDRCAIQRRVIAGRLHRIHVGVYAVGHRVLTGNGRLMAAALACGPRSVVSHVSAAGLWSLLTDSRRMVDVTVPARRRHSGVLVHTVRRLHDDDRTLVEGIPVTTVPRTPLDLAEAVPNRLDRALEEAERRGTFDLRELEAMMDHSHGRRGLGVLKAALSAYRDRPFTRSELERMLSDLCRAGDLPTPAFNIWIAGHEVDAVWWRERLVVELDGYEFHRTRAAFERDRRRDADLQLAGYRIVRFTHRQLENEPTEVIRTLRMLLAVTPQVHVP